MNKYIKSFNEDESKMIITQEGTPFMCELSKIYDNEIGIYYLFDNPMNMPLLRMNAYDNIQRAQSLGYSLTDVKNGFQNIIDIAQSQLPSKEFDIVHIAKSMQERLQSEFTLEQFYMMCTTLMVVSKDEDISIYSESVALDKLSKWRKAPQVLGFFLHKVKICIMEFAKRYEAIMPNYTKEVELTEEQKQNQLLMQLPL